MAKSGSGSGSGSGLGSVEPKDSILQTLYVLQGTVLGYQSTPSLTWHDPYPQHDPDRDPERDPDPDTVHNIPCSAIQHSLHIFPSFNQFPHYSSFLH
jgi:hypothetical protein